MKNRLNFILVCLAICLLFGSNIQVVKAATGTFSISSTSTVTKGNTFAVTIKATGSKIFYWQFYVSYDTAKLKLVNGSTTIQGEAKDATYGTSTITQTLSFRALNTGSAYVSVKRGDAAMNIDTNFNTVAYSQKQKTINVVPVVPKSSDNKLASLTIDETNLSPSFDGDVTKYTAELVPNTKEINIKATTSDSKAKVVGIGKIKVEDGNNEIKVVVTAENGSTKTYVIDAIVKEFDPIQVTVSGSTYNIVRKKEQYDAPVNFNETAIMIGKESVLAYTNEHIGDIVGLRDNKGNTELYLYNSKNDTYSMYDNITINNTNLYLKKLAGPSLIPHDYDRTSVAINEKNIIAWHYKNDDDYYLIYGVNTLNGDEGFYLYDDERGTIQRFYNDQVIDLEEEIDQMTLILTVTGSVIGPLITVLMIMLIRLSKKLKKPKSVVPQDMYLGTLNKPNKKNKK